MSIINEALKKAQAAKGHEALADGQGIRRHIELEFQQRRKGLNWGPIFVLLVLLLITAPIVAPIFSTPFRRETSFISAPTQRIPASQPISAQTGPVLEKISQNQPMAGRNAQFGIEEAPLAKLTEMASAPRPNLILSGIVYSPNSDSYGIINDKVVRVGESVQGAKLVQVAPDKVVLDYDGQRIELPVATL